MIQFSDREIESFRSRPEKGRMVKLLRELVSQFLSMDLRIPETGCADWSHYYYCPDCSVALIFDPASPLDHVCPSCGRHFSDEKMNGAWWRLMDAFNEDASYRLGLLYMLTGDMEAAGKVRDVLMGYARYYPGYEEHGNIPYNGPGRLNAQTLDEANFLRNLAYAYDLIEETLSEDERGYIKERLFREGMEFLKANRHSQIHNHEVICNGAIGVLALILGDKESLSFAMDGDYGLIYQLEHGVLEDGFWFECSTAYHFYALQNFLLYEKFAKNTPYSNLDHPNYRKMFSAILRIEKSDHSYPLLNDSHPEQGSPDGYSLFEFAWHRWHDPEILPILHSIYERKERLSIESFLYGDETLPPSPCRKKRGSLEGRDGLGATVIRRGPVYLLLRHGPYGGEHDHYDRLGISYCYDDIPVSIDIGTTGYGAVLHYAYYKNTVTHNTVALDGENQSPSCGHLLSFSENEDASEAKAFVRWEKGYRMPDSFTIKQWSDEAYEGAYMERHVKVTDNAVIDLFTVRLPSPHTIGHFMHFNGTRIASGDAAKCREAFAETGPLSHLHGVMMGRKGDVLHTAYDSSGIITDVFSFSPDASIYLASGPDNPSSSDMSYVRMEKEGTEASFVTVMASGRKPSGLADVSFARNGDGYDIQMRYEDGSVRTCSIGG